MGSVFKLGHDSLDLSKPFLKGSAFMLECKIYQRDIFFVQLAEPTLRPALPEKPKLLEIVRNDLCSY